MTKNNKVLFVLLTFNALSAIGGGIALMAGGIKQTSLISHTSFTSLYFPGVILLTIVGGSSFVASVALIKKLIAWQLVSLLAGTIMLFWIIAEITSIRQVHWLQVIYIATGISVIYLSTDSSEADGKRKI